MSEDEVIGWAVAVVALVEILWYAMVCDLSGLVP